MAKRTINSLLHTRGSARTQARGAKPARMQLPPGNAASGTPPADSLELKERLRLDAFIPYRLSVISNIISTAIAGAYAERFKLSIPEWRVMAVLGLEPGLSAAQVAERTAMDKVAVSRAVTGLLHSRRVQRAFDDADKRRSMLKLSRTGEAVYARVIPFAREYERRLLESFSPAQRAQLDDLLTQLVERARALGPAVGPKVDPAVGD